MRDIRRKGFAERAAVAMAEEWIDRHASTPADEAVAVTEAVGRVLSTALAAPCDAPDTDIAGADGYAVRAADTVGAGDYNPLRLAAATEPPLPVGGAMLIAAGAPMPRGADAILPFEVAEAKGGAIEIVAAAAEGALVEGRGQQLRAGTALFAAGHVLRPQDVGLLAALAIGAPRVVRRPRIRLVILGAKFRRGDADGPMLAALVARDGGIAEAVDAAPTPASIRAALLAPGADAILIAGRSGAGDDDIAPAALAEAGRLDLHGIALRPGGSAGLGEAGGVPVILLPGDPLACLCVYDLLAGRLVRRLAGRDPALPYATREVELGRKIVSAIGLLDLCRLRLVAGRAEPVGAIETGGLASAARADGFVLVPEALEGYPPGARIRLHLYDGWRA
ncbi:MAG TPA: molybdopterin-binding protein [Stellaceae bacterium]|nr:molybdopterin-binding protein [Stellaceae bacterium]